MEKGVPYGKRFGVGLVLGALAFFLVGLCSPQSWAAEKPYPTRPITMVVPFTAGGAIDLSSKIVADKVSAILGQPIISTYKPGGAGPLGSAFVAKSKPDGYTVLAGGMSPLIIVPITKKLDYKYDDLISVGIYAKMPLWLAVKADSKWKTLKDFVEEAKKSPGKLIAASYGKGTASHFGLDLFNKRAGIELTHVPYKSSGETLTAVLGGHADCAFATGSGGLLEAGSVRILAIAAEQRLEDLPAIPTFLEFGYQVNIPGWFTLCFPKGTPKEIVDIFYRGQKQAFERNTGEMKEALRRVDQWMTLMNPHYYTSTS